MFNSNHGFLQYKKLQNQLELGTNIVTKFFERTTKVTCENDEVKKQAYLQEMVSF
jgi:hypothetical protein